MERGWDHLGLQALTPFLKEERAVVEAAKVWEKGWGSPAAASPTVFTYSTLICGLCEGGAVRAVENLFRAILESRVRPNLYVYNALMNGCCKDADVGRALVLYQTRSIVHGCRMS